MAKFKVGDKVKCNVPSCGFHEKNKVFVVTDVYPESDMIRTTGKYELAVDGDTMTLVESTESTNEIDCPFKVGDLIRLKNGKLRYIVKNVYHGLIQYAVNDTIFDDSILGDNIIYYDPNAFEFASLMVGDKVVWHSGKQIFRIMEIKDENFYLIKEIDPPSVLALKSDLKLVAKNV